MSKAPIDPYYQSRYTFDKDRTTVWKEIVRYLDPYLPKEGAVVDLGAGYCDFINNAPGKVRYAVDTSPDLSRYAGDTVIQINGTAWDMPSIADGSVDVVHASNLFEHFDDGELAKAFAEVRRVLKPGGALILLQPNYYYAYRGYFDDPTHKKVFSHESLNNMLMTEGFSVVLRKNRFLPFSMKSRPSLIPVQPLIVRAYIHSPIKPGAGQMLFVARKA